MLVAISNVCFSLRAILGRQLKAAHGTGPVRLFSQMSLIAAGLQALVLGGRALFSPVAVRAELTGAATVLAARPVLAALNGLGFYAQLQLSFVCLSRMSALSHSLANSMRRPVTIVAALAFAPALLTPANWAGVALACARGAPPALLRRAEKTLARAAAYPGPAAAACLLPRAAPVAAM